MLCTCWGCGMATEVATYKTKERSKESAAMELPSLGVPNNAGERDWQDACA